MIVECIHFSEEYFIKIIYCITYNISLCIIEIVTLTMFKKNISKNFVELENIVFFK